MTSLVARLHSGWKGDVAGLAAGAALPLAYAPFGIFPLAVLAPAVLAWLWLHVPPRRAFRRGFLFGLGMFGVGVNWVYVSMYEFGGVPFGLSLFLTALFISFLALFTASLGALLAAFYRRPGALAQRLALLLAFPAAWVFFEWIRGWFLTGFPWLSLGYSQIDSPLAGWAPLVGVYGVSFATALSAGLLLMMLRPGEARRHVHGMSLALLWLGGWALGLVTWTQPSGEPIKVSLIQGNISQDVKWRADMRLSSVELYLSLTREHWDSELIVWPETALPAFHYEAEEFLDALGEEARGHGTDLLVGLLSGDPDGRYYNSMVSVGSQSAFYHKHHLVPFTEYLPMKAALGGLIDFMQVPMSDFTSGAARQTPLAAAGQRVGISICYEDVFGEEVIRALPEATLLVNVSNDAWFGTSIAPHQHMQIARMRALETGRPLLRATNTGVTGSIDPRGRLRAVAPQFEVHVLTDTVQPMQGLTPYARWGNVPVVVLVIVLLGIAKWRMRVAPFHEKTPAIEPSAQ